MLAYLIYIFVIDRNAHLNAHGSTPIRRSVYRMPLSPSTGIVSTSTSQHYHAQSHPSPGLDKTLLNVGHFFLGSEQHAPPPRAAAPCPPHDILPCMSNACALMSTACCHLLLPRLEFWKHIGRYFPARVIKTTDLDPKEHYICGAGREGGRYMTTPCYSRHCVYRGPSQSQHPTLMVLLQFVVIPMASPASAMWPTCSSRPQASAKYSQVGT